MDALTAESERAWLGRAWIGRAVVTLVLVLAVPAMHCLTAAASMLMPMPAAVVTSGAGRAMAPPVSRLAGQGTRAPRPPGSGHGNGYTAHAVATMLGSCAGHPCQARLRIDAKTTAPAQFADAVPACLVLFAVSASRSPGPARPPPRDTSASRLCIWRT